MYSDDYIKFVLEKSLSTVDDRLSKKIIIGDTYVDFLPSTKNIKVYRSYTISNIEIKSKNKTVFKIFNDNYNFSNSYCELYIDSMCMSIFDLYKYSFSDNSVKSYMHYVESFKLMFEFARNNKDSQNLKRTYKINKIIGK